MKRITPFVFHTSILTISLLIFYHGILKENAMIVGNQAIYNFTPWQDKANTESMRNYNYENNWYMTLTTPYYKINQNALQNNNIPLWNPLNEGGLPYIANFESSFFYPTNLLLSLFGWYPLLNWIILAKLLFSGLGFLILMRYLNIDKGVGLVATIAFIFNGFHHTWLSFAHINSVILLPWLVLLLLKILRENKILTFNGIIYSVLLGVMWLGGHPETCVYICLGLFIYTITYIYYYDCDFKVKKIGSILVYMLLGLTIASIQIIPFVEYMLDSHRYSSVTDAINFETQIPLFSITNYLFPDIFGNPLDSNFWAWDYGPQYFFIWRD